MATINSSLNDKLIAQAALEAFTAELAPISAFSTSYSPEVVRRGATVEVPVVASITATTFADSYEVAGGVLNKVTITLDQHKIATVGLSDTEYSKSSVADLTKFATQQGKAVAQAVISYVWSLLVTTSGSAAQYSATLTGLTTLSLANVRALRKALSNENVPQMDRALVLDPDLYDGLLSTVSDASAFGARDAIADGRAARVYGMNVFESTVIPSNSISLKGFAIHPSALALAVRALEPQAPSEYLASESMVDPQSGLTLGYRRHFNTGTGIHWCSFSAVFGASRGLTGGAKLALGS